MTADRSTALRAALLAIDDLIYNREEYDMTPLEAIHEITEIAQTALAEDEDAAGA